VPSRRTALAALGATLAARRPLSARTLTHLTVVTSPSDSGGEVYYAQDRGTFRTFGLDVELISLAGGAAVAAAMSSGTYDIGQGNLATIGTAREAGLPFVLVAPASLYDYRAATTALVVAQDSPIHTAGDLAGKSVADLSVQDIGTVALGRWLTQNGVDPASVRIVELPSSATEEALVRGTVSAALLLEPFLSKAFVNGTIRLLAHVYSAIAPNFMIAAYFARADWVRSHRDAARAFAGALRETARWANTHHAESAQILAKYTKTQIAPNQTRTMYADTLDPKLIQPLLDAAYKGKMMKEPLSAAALLTP
jgi:NitT/TauT family transport system substrate-binding protein